MNLGEIQEIVQSISIGDPNLYDAKLTILIRLDGTRPYLQIRCDNAKDAKTGEDTHWTSRKWMLSYHMCRSEVVRTAYKAYITALLHEADEQFRYRGVPIYSPHFDVDKLVDSFQEDARVNGMTGV